MNAKTSFIAAIALTAAAAGSTVFAQEAVYDIAQPVQASTTRAGVQAELAAARAAGTIQYGEITRVADTFVSQRTRGDVRAETVAAIARGELAALNREPNGFDVGNRSSGSVAVPAVVMGTVGAAR